MKDLDLTLLCHGRPNTHSETERLRKPEDKELLHATACRRRLGNPTFDLVLSSPILGTQEVTKIIAGFTNGRVPVDLSSLFCGDDDTDAHSLEAAFALHSENPLKRWLRDGGAARMILDRGRRVVAEIAEVISRENPEAKTVLVVGPSILITAAIRTMTSAYCLLLEGHKPGVCEGYLIRVRRGDVDDVVIIKY